LLAHISHACAEKGNFVLTVLALFAAYGGWRLVRTLWQSLRALPRRNEDMVFF
jgi:hypothetical protein